MPKSTKRFVISSSSLNSQGFRMLTSGAVLDGFRKNPLLLFNHIRPEGNKKNQILPLGHWEDIEIKGDEITGVPVFDDKDAFAMQIYNKVEAGHIRMCSAGAEPLATSKKKSDLLPGQELATVTKWTLREASSCDIGANPDSMDVALYDKSDRLINLRSNSIETIIPKITDKMAKQTKTVAEAFAALKKAKDAKKAATEAFTLAAEKVELALADEDTSDEDKTKMSDEMEPDSQDDKDKKLAEALKRCKELEDKVNELTAKLEDQDNKSTEAKAHALAEKAHIDRKIKAIQKPHIVKLAIADFKAAEDYVKSLPSLPSAKDTIEGNSGPNTGNSEDTELKKLAELSFDDLFKSGKLELLKDKMPQVYAMKFEKKFGKKPKA